MIKCIQRKQQQLQQQLQQQPQQLQGHFGNFFQNVQTHLAQIDLAVSKAGLPCYFWSKDAQASLLAWCPQALFGRWISSFLVVFSCFCFFAFFVRFSVFSFLFFWHNKTKKRKKRQVDIILPRQEFVIPESAVAATFCSV